MKNLTEKGMLSLMTTWRTATAISLLCTVLVAPANSYEARPDTHFVTATINVLSDQIDINNIQGSGVPAGSDGILVSWFGDYDFSEKRTIQAIAEIAVSNNYYEPDDVQKISRVTVGGSYLNFTHQFTTQAYTHNNSQAIRIDNFGRPTVFSPSIAESGMKRYSFNWYISEFGSYLEVVPLAGNNIYDSMIVLLTYQGAGKTISRQLYDDDATDVSIKIFIPAGTNITSTATVRSFKQIDLRNDLNDNYALKIGPPVTPTGTVRLPQDFINKSDEAVSLLTVVNVIW